MQKRVPNLKKEEKVKKLSIIRFKPKPEHFGEFIQSLKHHLSLPERTAITDSFVMTKDDEVYSIVVRKADQLVSDAKQGVEYLDSVRHMLQEFNEVDRHTLPVTGDLVE